MTRPPDIESSWAESFWNPAGVKASSNDVQKTLGKDMGKTDRSIHLRDAK